MDAIPIPKKEAKIKAGRFCAYQERTQQEVREKLLKLNVLKDEIEEIIAELISENFINEERFAKTYASRKFRLKKWGRNKIVQALVQKGLTQYCIDQGLKEIEERVYSDQLRELIRVRYEKLNEPNVFHKKHNISKYLITRGYEPDLVWENIDFLYPR